MFNIYAGAHFFPFTSCLSALLLLVKKKKVVVISNKKKIGGLHTSSIY